MICGSQNCRVCAYPSSSCNFSLPFPAEGSMSQAVKRIGRRCTYYVNDVRRESRTCSTPVSIKILNMNQELVRLIRSIDWWLAVNILARTHLAPGCIVAAAEQSQLKTQCRRCLSPLIGHGRPNASTTACNTNCYGLSSWYLWQRSLKSVNGVILAFISDFAWWVMGCDRSVTTKYMPPRT